jgi:hypothetical protein|tara:strand:- start:448 stop:597 length:150 start_codon:yes stop_codon:yes gene_type:complete
MVDWVKIFGVNGASLGIVSLTELELGLKVLLLGLTCAWSAIKLVKLIKE